MDEAPAEAAGKLDYALASGRFRLHYIQGSFDGLQDHRRWSRREDERTSFVDKILDDDGWSRHKGTAHAQCLSTGRNNSHGLILYAKLFHEARTAAISVQACGMGIIHDEIGSVSLCERSVPIQRSDVTVHAEEGLGQEKDSAPVRFPLQLLFNRCDIEVRECLYLASAESEAVKDACVVLRIG
jgi:hypothetical protein